MKILVAKHTDVGGRENNEDYLLAGVYDGNYLFALADGLGGHGLGDIASKLACNSALKKLASAGEINNDALTNAFEFCQTELIKKQQELHATGKMRTTLNLLCLDGQTAYWGHVGDSRTYYFENQTLIKRTFDHSVPQMLVAMGELPESQIRFHEDRNRLLKVLGVDEKPLSFELENPIPLKDNQQFLMCSDGFWEFITEEQILLCLEDSDTPQLWLDNMLELVRINSKNKVTDNITAIAVWIKGGN